MVAVRTRILADESTESLKSPLGHFAGSIVISNIVEADLKAFTLQPKNELQIGFVLQGLSADPRVGH